MRTERLLPALLVLVPALLVSGCTSLQGPGGGGVAIPCNGTTNLVQPGDTVKVEYTSRHVTGKIIERGTITFVSMAGHARYGFDEAVEGMCIGQEKHVSVPPEKAYGLRDPSLVKAIPLQTETNRTFSVQLSSFTAEFGRNPVAGGLYESANLSYPVRVIAVSGDTVMLDKAVTVGYRIKAGVAEPWPIDVIRVTPEKITFFRNVTDGQEVKTSAGNRTVSVSNGTITLDLNHPFAGETILYDIKVISLEKA